jgi:hypothetical protein
LGRSALANPSLCSSSPEPVSEADPVICCFLPSVRL